VVKGERKETRVSKKDYVKIKMRKISKKDGGENGEKEEVYRGG
jgi:hypothetical protein